MPKINARDVALIVVSGSLAAAAALVARLPSRPDENALLGLIGSLIGAAIAVIASLLVLARQFETADERHLNSLRALISDLRQAGVAMAAHDAALDPAGTLTKAWPLTLRAKLSPRTYGQTAHPLLVLLSGYGLQGCKGS